MGRKITASFTFCLASDCKEFVNAEKLQRIIAFQPEKAAFEADNDKLINELLSANENFA